MSDTETKVPEESTKPKSVPKTKFMYPSFDKPRVIEAEDKSKADKEAEQYKTRMVTAPQKTKKLKRRKN